MTEIVKCNKCGAVINEAANVQPDKRRPCPSCGSTSRCFEVFITSKLVLSEKIGMKAKHADCKKPFIEQISGAELNRATGKNVDKIRVIDRENDLYQEIIKDPKTGEVIHQCIEPLSAHIGHGDPKKKH